VLSPYAELVTVMARADSHIENLADLAGRRINVGSRATGTRATRDAIEEELGWRDAERVRPVGMRADATISALCDGAIDANMLIVGHPSPLVKAQQAACAIKLVAITGPAIDKLLHKHLYYHRETIPADLYGLPADVPTFGWHATLVTSASVDIRVVAVVAKEVLGQLTELRTLRPALARLRPSKSGGAGDFSGGADTAWGSRTERTAMPSWLESARTRCFRCTSSCQVGPVEPFVQSIAAGIGDKVLSKK
jgi:TRAP transporter TAXI family solute receptor